MHVQKEGLSQHLTALTRLQRGRVQSDSPRCTGGVKTPLTPIFRHSPTRDVALEKDIPSGTAFPSGILTTQVLNSLHAKWSVSNSKVAIPPSLKLSRHIR